eukprot:354691-Chlamydomonas_euryale.AAC.20
MSVHPAHMLRTSSDRDILHEAFIRRDMQEETVTCQHSYVHDLSKSLTDPPSQELHKPEGKIPPYVQKAQHPASSLQAGNAVA